MERSRIYDESQGVLLYLLKPVGLSMVLYLASSLIVNLATASVPLTSSSAHLGWLIGYLSINIRHSFSAKLDIGA